MHAREFWPLPWSFPQSPHALRRPRRISVVPPSAEHPPRSDDDRVLKVLVVEDSELARRQLAGAVAELGYSAVTACSADEALLLFDDSIALVITDVEMSGHSGIDLLRAVRTSRPGLPFICMSSSMWSLGEASRAGADAVLAKPFDFDDLRVTLGLLLVASGASPRH